MAKNAIARWSNPEVILVATTLLEDHTLMQHAMYQAKLSKASVLLVHVIPPSSFDNRRRLWFAVYSVESDSSSHQGKVRRKQPRNFSAKVSCVSLLSLKGFPKRKSLCSSSPGLWTESS